MGEFVPIVPAFEKGSQGPQFVPEAQPEGGAAPFGYNAEQSVQVRSVGEAATRLDTSPKVTDDGHLEFLA